LGAIRQSLRAEHGSLKKPFSDFSANVLVLVHFLHSPERELTSRVVYGQLDGRRFQAAFLLNRSIVLHRFAVPEGNALQQQLDLFGAVDAAPGFLGFLDQLCAKNERRPRIEENRWNYKSATNWISWSVSLSRSRTVSNWRS
jgi:hypothetical protein